MAGDGAAGVGLGHPGPSLGASVLVQYAVTVADPIAADDTAEKLDARYLNMPG